MLELQMRRVLQARQYPAVVAVVLSSDDAGHSKVMVRHKTKTAR